MKIKKFISAVTLIAYSLCVVPTIAHASDTDPKITTLRKGQLAPYSGTLFNTPAAAQLQVDLKFTKATCKIQTDRQIGLIKSELQLDIDLLTARLQSQEMLHTDILLIKNDQIKFLEGYSLERKWHESNEFWLVSGLVAGIVVTAIAGWSLGQASR